MASGPQHSRRDFLKGRAAVRSAAGAAQAWVDSASAGWSAKTQAMGAGEKKSLHHCASRRAMACEFEVQYHAVDDATEAVLEALDLIEQLEDQMTIYRDESEVIAINRQAAQGPVEVEAELFSLLELAARIYRETHGALDITSGPLSRTWGFLHRQARLPSEEEIQQAMQRVGFEHVELDAPQQTIQFCDAQVEINFNAIGKGYALDRAAGVLAQHGLTDYLWHGGRSSVLARGRNRAEPKQAWSVGLRHPLKPECQLAEFFLRDRALATAGGATQFFEHHGRQLGHVLDPRTGWPAEGVFTATVLAPTAAEADALATAFYVMGPDEVAKYCADHTEIGAVLVCPADEKESRVDQVTLHAFGVSEEDWSRN